MYIVIKKEYKDRIILTEMATFKNKGLSYWLYILEGKLRKKEIEVIKEG